MKSSDEYIPFEATAKDITRHDENIGQFILTVFPDAADDQIDKFVHFIAGIFHDGIEFGSAVSDLNPMKPIDAYKMGYIHGKQDRD